MTVMTAGFEYVLPLIILIGVIASLIDKFKKAAEENQRQQRGIGRQAPPKPPTLPEATRRQIYGTGEPSVRRARPLVLGETPPADTEGRNDSGEGANDERYPQAPVQPRPARPVVVPPASTPWGELRRQLEQGARGFEQEVRRQVAEAKQRQGGTPSQSEYERQQQLPRQQREADEAQRRQTAPRAARPAQTAEAPRPEARKPAPRAKRVQRPKHRPHPLLGNALDIRRAIVMREVLGPPKALE